jgi:hypothetical protein
MANPEKPQYEGQVKTRPSHGSALEQGKVELSKEDLDKVVGGRFGSGGGAGTFFFGSGGGAG